MRKLFIALAMLLLVGAQVGVRAQDGASEVRGVTSVTLLQSEVTRYGMVELVAEIDATFTNPYDPNDIRVDGRFTAPSGDVIVVPGFWYQAFTDVEGGSPIPTDDWSWRVRFTPTEAGEYRYQVVAAALTQSVRSVAGTFTVGKSEEPGFIRIDARNPRYFAFDNGAPYFPIGENIGWSTSSDPLADYDQWLADLSAAGGNFVRVWMAPWGFGIEWNDTGLGNYDGRQMQAYQLDGLLGILDKYDVYMMLSLLNHGQFNETTDPQWDQNPYNAANGGMCGEPACFATDPEAIRLWHQRLRYIAARWGYSTHIMTWEWWNEVNWTPLLNSDILAPWIERSAAYLRTLDPYGHLITHEGSPVNDAAVWSQDNLDFTQDHRYIQNSATNSTSLVSLFRELIPEWLDAYPDKPFIMGEFGQPLEIDRIGLYLHLGMWSAAMNGSGGSGMTWYWDDYVAFYDLYEHFAGFSAFMRDEDMGARQWQPTSAAFDGRAGASVYGLQANDYALLWVVNSRYRNETLMSQYNQALREAILNRAQRGVDFSFEDGAQGWTLDSAGSAGVSADVSDAQATDGASALALTANFTGGAQEAGAVFSPEGGIDWSSHTTLSLDVYAPEGATNFGVQVYTLTGEGRVDTGSQHVALTPGEWTRVTVPFNLLGDLSDVRALGVRINTNFTVFEGTFAIDNLRFSDEPDVQFEFPTIEREAIDVTGLEERDYTVSFWDPVTGEVVGTQDVYATGGTINIPLPSFTTDLAIKVQPK